MKLFQQKSSPGLYTAVGISLGIVAVADYFTPLGITVWTSYLVPLALTLFLWQPQAAFLTAFATSLANLDALSIEQSRQ